MASKQFRNSVKAVRRLPNLKEHQYFNHTFILSLGLGLQGGGVLAQGGV